MQRSRIEWCDYSVNPVKGICKTGCSYCYAIRMYKRFKWNPEIRYEWMQFQGLEKLTAGSKVFIGSTHDIFGDWIKKEWIEDILWRTKLFPWLTFILLTKNPQRYSEFDFPKNAWIGYSTTGTLFHKWDERHNDNVKFVSLEPMQETINASIEGFAQKIDFQWLIIGQETGNRKKHIVTSSELLPTLNFARKADMKIFVKNNLATHFDETCIPELKGIPQEYPEVK